MQIFLDQLIEDQALSNFQAAHMIWKAKVPSIVQLLPWSLALGKLNTGDVIQRRNLMCASLRLSVPCAREMVKVWIFAFALSNCCLVMDLMVKIASGS